MVLRIGLRDASADEELAPGAVPVRAPPNPVKVRMASPYSKVRSCVSDATPGPTVFRARVPHLSWPDAALLL